MKTNMIDTVVLQLKNDQFQVKDYHKFSPSLSLLYSVKPKKGGYIKAKYNPTRQEKNNSYLPKLTAIKRFVNHTWSMYLYIEFSAPKLVYGNNFEEIDEDEFDGLLQVLKERLLSMGIIPNLDMRNALISKIHYSKNIILQNYLTPYLIIKELSKINLNLQLDINQTDYRNEGYCLRYRNNSFELVFYDKLKDLEKGKISDKRALEDDNLTQLPLLKKLRKLKPFEVFRIEIRLNKIKAIRSNLKRIGIESEIVPTFKFLFDKNIAKKLLISYWKQIQKQSYLIEYKPVSQKDFFMNMYALNTKIKLRKLLQTIGMKVLLDEVGIREFRGLIKQFGKSNWYSLYKEAEKLTFPASRISFWEDIRQYLEDFRIVKLKDYNVN